MTKSELTAALAIATSDRPLANVDDSALSGLYLPDFKAPAHVTLEAAARTVRDLAVQFNGTLDNAALDEFGRVARHRVLIVG